MKKQYKVLVLLFSCASLSAHVPMATQNDCLPLHSTLYPFGFLNENIKEYQKGITQNSIKEQMRFYGTFFGQKATSAKNQDKNTVPAGDVRGRWNMIGLLYGSVPTGQTRAALLTTAAAQTYQDGQNLNYENYSDVNDNLGHFSIPLNYRKMGARFGFATRIAGDLVFSFEGGVSDIKQTYSSFTNRDNTAVVIQPQDVYGSSSPAGVDTSTSPYLQTDRATVDTYLMDIHSQIFNQMGLTIQDFHGTGPEDIFIGLTWRHNFYVNAQEDDEYAPFVLTPFFNVTGMIGIGKEQDQSKAFSLPFGNNGHHGVSVSTGFSLDFYESVEITWQAGATHFFKRDVKGMYIPTNEQQTGVFPFKTDVSYDPGKTWYFRVGMNAYHMIDKVSCYIAYNFLNHSKDTINLISPDSAFKPTVLEDQTKWTVQSLDIGFNADIAPHMSIGIAWQAPIGRQGAYKTNTVAATVAATF